MNILPLPYPIYEFSDVSLPANSLQNFFSSMIRGYNALAENWYREEIYGLKTASYEVYMDINILLTQLLRIKLAIARTETPKTYAEYMEEYHVDCIFKVLLCKGVNVKALMIAFDEGYRNIYSTPAGEGVGYMIIETDFIIN